MRCSFYARREGFAAFSSNAGQLGGFDIASLVLVEDEFMGLEFVRLYRAGHFSAWGAADNSVPYSDLEFYSAGMLPAGELHGDFVNMQTAAWHVDEAGNPILDVGTGEPLILNIPLDHPAIEVDSFVWRYSAEELVEGYGELPLNPDPVFTGAVVLIVDGEHPARPSGARPAGGGRGMARQSGARRRPAVQFLRGYRRPWATQPRPTVGTHAPGSAPPCRRSGESTATAPPASRNPLAGGGGSAMIKPTPGPGTPTSQQSGKNLHPWPASHPTVQFAAPMCRKSVSHVSFKSTSSQDSTRKEN